MSYSYAQYYCIEFYSFFYACVLLAQAIMTEEKPQGEKMIGKKGEKWDISFVLGFYVKEIFSFLSPLWRKEKKTCLPSAQLELGRKLQLFVPPPKAQHMGKQGIGDWSLPKIKNKNDWHSRKGKLHCPWVFISFQFCCPKLSQCKFYKRSKHLPGRYNKKRKRSCELDI